MQCNNMGGLKAPKQHCRSFQQAARAAIRKTDASGSFRQDAPRRLKKQAKSPQKKQNKINERDPARRIVPDPPGPKRDAN